MAAERRIYQVIHTHGDKVTKRLVNAAHPVTAIKFVMKDAVVATVASQTDLVKLLGEGIKVEDATAEE